MLYTFKLFLLLLMALSSIAYSSDLHAKTAEELSAKELIAIAIKLNNLQRYTEAADLLERALLLNPHLSAGRMEYQKSLAGIQQRQGNRTSNHGLHSLWQTDWKVNKQAYFKAGVSDNLNRAPTSSVIPLTISGQTINVLLAEDERPKSGQGIELGLALDAYTRLSSDVEILATAEVIQRKGTQTEYTNYQWGQFALSWVEAVPNDRHLIWGVTADILNYDHQRPFYVLQGLMRYGFPTWQNCRPQLGIDIQHQGQQKNQALEGYYLGGVAALNCLNKNKAYVLQLALGQDWAKEDRLGGDQVKARLQMSYNWNVGEWLKGDNLKTTASYYRQQDKRGYSLSLNNGSKRKTQRVEAMVEYTWPIRMAGKNWHGSVKIEWMQQKSNIQLFETSAQEMWFGITKSW